MYLRTLMILAVLGLIAVFSALNWSAFIAPTALSLGFTSVEAPLGLILLGDRSVVNSSLSRLHHLFAINRSPREPPPRTRTAVAA